MTAQELKPTTIGIVDANSSLGAGLIALFDRGMRNHIGDKHCESELHARIEHCAHGHQVPAMLPTPRPVHLRILNRPMKDDADWLLKRAHEALAMTGYAGAPVTVDFVSSDTDLKGVDYYFIMGNVVELANGVSESTAGYTRVKYTDIRIYDTDDDNLGQGFMLFM